MHDIHGRERWFRLNMTLQKGETPDDDILLILGQAIDEEKMKEEKISRQANVDFLTQFYNRNYCEYFLEKKKKAYPKG